MHHEELFCEFILNWDRRKCRLKILLTWSSGSPFVQWSGTISVILVEPSMRNSSVKLFFSEFRPMVMEEMLFKDISYLELWQPFCSTERNHLCNFGRECYEERFCEIILNLGQWFRCR